jgi:choline-sulfatase
VKFIDDAVGRLLGALDDRGMRENTLIVFTADHGHTIGDYGTHDKRFFYEQSVGVPLVMSGAGVPRDEREPENVSKLLVSGVDLYPTFLDVAGCKNEGGDRIRTGISLVRLLAGREKPREAVFSELGTATMVRDAGWKLVYDPQQGGVEQLFNLRHDPDELVNLAGVPDYGDIEAVLVRRILDHTILLTRHTHTKERMRLQRVRVG